MGLFRIKTEYLFKPFDFPVVSPHKSHVLQGVLSKNGASRYKAASCNPLNLFVYFFFFICDASPVKEKGC